MLTRRASFFPGRAWRKLMAQLISTKDLMTSRPDVRLDAASAPKTSTANSNAKKLFQGIARKTPDDGPLH